MNVARRQRRSALAMCAALVVVTGCASMPSANPAGPLPKGQVAEVGGAGGAFVGYGNDDNYVPLDRAGALTTLYGRYTFLEHIDVGASVTGGGALGFGVDPAPAFTPKGPHYTFGGRLSLVYRTSVFQSLHVGGGFHIDYLESSIGGPVDRRVGALVSIPMSERVWEDIFITIRPTAGIMVPLYAGAVAPFFPVVECPIGVSWRVLKWLSLTAEGGYHPPSQGVLVTAGAAASF